MDQKNEIGLAFAVKVLWQRKILISLITFLFIGGSIAYALLAMELFKVKCIIKPSENSSEVMLTSAPTGLGGVFGVIESPVLTRIKLTLSSDQFIEQFYNKYKDEKRLFYKDILDDIKKEDLPDKEKKLKLRHFALEHLNDVIGFKEEKSETFSIYVELPDKYFAYELLGEVLESLKTDIRESNIAILEDDIKFYSKMLSKSNSPLVDTQIQKIIDTKIKKRFTLSSNLFYLVEKPSIPFKRSWPKRAITVVISTILGFIITWTSVLIYEVSKKKY